MKYKALTRRRRFRPPPATLARKEEWNKVRMNEADREREADGFLGAN